MSLTSLTSLADVNAAARRIADVVVRTPLLPCEPLSEEFGATVLVKAENLQPSGSFKVRGVFNALLARDSVPAGVATFSAGNAAAAVAYAARRLGIPAAVCMMPTAVPAKVDAVRRYGAEIVFTEDLLGTCEQLCADRSFHQLHPFDDLDLIAGHGTAALEILADCPDPDVIVVPVGGGGLISGIAATVKALHPSTRVIGVEPSAANAMTHALRTGRPDPLPAKPSSIADGLNAPFAAPNTLAHTQAFVDDILEVSEDAIQSAWPSMLQATKLLLEPSAAVPLAALRTGTLHLKPGATTILLATGGNTTIPGR